MLYHLDRIARASIGTQSGNRPDDMGADKMRTIPILMMLLILALALTPGCSDDDLMTEVEDIELLDQPQSEFSATEEMHLEVYGGRSEYGQYIVNEGEYENSVQDGYFGGYILGTEGAESPFDLWMTGLDFSAPSEFLGNKTPYAGGTLEYSL
ncbi:MAG: hypothetical protein KOO60_02330 [Gemmatimonadales bacterium]|nr:hypothetical protein [Gemmatimonadales bacterium]